MEMLNELNNKIVTLEEKIDKIGTWEERISSLGQYLVSTGTAQIDGAVVRFLSGLNINENKAA